MPESNFLQEVLSRRPAGEIPNLESAIVSSRRWAEYQSVLGVTPEALENETVLNFGSGGSNIAKDLKVECNVVELDLKYDPSGTSENLFKYFALTYINGYLEDFNPQGKLKQKLVRLKRRLGETEGRKFVQGNGRTLPFPNQVFDHVLALWSTYQIPPRVRESVYKELMRVGNILHLGPIFKNDYNLLQRLAAESGYEIVACQPIPKTIVENVPFMFSSKKDYDTYIQQKSRLGRVQEPKKDEADVITKLGVKQPRGEGGNTIVLKRKPV